MRLRSGLTTGPPGTALTEAQQPTISNDKPKWLIRDATFFWPPDVAIVIRRRCGVENDNEDVPRMPGHYTRRQILKKPILSTSSKLFTTLAYELVYKILGFMQPKEYTGLTCTCRLALDLTNTQVEIERRGLGRKYKMFVSYTGIYTALQEVEAKRERDGNPLNYPPLLEEEPDL
ncbi:hypothetical protein KCV07_g9312, partial [Aureobasidium melanogenum]